MKDRSMARPILSCWARSRSRLRAGGGSTRGCRRGSEVWLCGGRSWSIRFNSENFWWALAAFCCICSARLCNWKSRSSSAFACACSLDRRSSSSRTCACSLEARSSSPACAWACTFSARSSSARASAASLSSRSRSARARSSSAWASALSTLASSSRSRSSGVPAPSTRPPPPPPELILAPLPGPPPGGGGGDAQSTPWSWSACLTAFCRASHWQNSTTRAWPSPASSLRSSFASRWSFEPCRRCSGLRRGSDLPVSTSPSSVGHAAAACCRPVEASSSSTLRTSPGLQGSLHVGHCGFDLRASCRHALWKKCEQGIRLNSPTGTVSRQKLHSRSGVLRSSSAWSWRKRRPRCAVCNCETSSRTAALSTSMALKRSESKSAPS
mmetsp:Transcript_121273/g.343607  ORF Transcript_121273/g.343607 Transcript_121273/m.343607 type:complete len:383 (-) Transcript_121273:472-1620(-)